MLSAKQGSCKYYFLVFWYDSTWEMNPRSTDCEADAPTTTPSHKLKTYILIENTYKHLSKYKIQVNISWPQLLHIHFITTIFIKFLNASLLLCIKQIYKYCMQASIVCKQIYNYKSATLFMYSMFTLCSLTA